MVKTSKYINTATKIYKMVSTSIAHAGNAWSIRVAHCWHGDITRRLLTVCLWKGSDIQTSWLLFPPPTAQHVWQRAHFLAALLDQVSTSLITLQPFVCPSHLHRLFHDVTLSFRPSQAPPKCFKMPSGLPPLPLLSACWLVLAAPSQRPTTPHPQLLDRQSTSHLDKPPQITNNNHWKSLSGCYGLIIITIRDPSKMWHGIELLRLFINQ